MKETEQKDEQKKQKPAQKEKELAPALLTLLAMGRKPDPDELEWK